MLIVEARKGDEVRKLGVIDMGRALEVEASYRWRGFHVEIYEEGDPPPEIVWSIHQQRRGKDELRV